MKKSILTNIYLFIALTFCTASISWSADFQKGMTAYKNGDYATALREWTPLAEQGDANAQFNLGLMYANGQGVPQDYKTAAKWYKLAAEQGDAIAQLNLGFMYYNGKGVPQDYKTAVKWYTLSAEQGYATAQYNLGVMYGNGQGVPIDYVYAYMWFNLAAASGQKEAITGRDVTAKKMTQSQIEKAQDLSRECFRKNYKGC